MADKFNVTIIIPHYNTPDLLEKLICSIPDKEDVQTIVIDDNSTNEVEKYERIKKDYGLRVNFYQNDTGMQSAGSCRNTGLDHAEGKWLLFADADDYFLPDMYDIVKNYFVSDYDIVFFLSTSVCLDTGEISNRHTGQEERILQYLKEPNEENAIGIRCMREPWGKLIRRDLIERRNIRFSQALFANDMYFSTVAGFYARKICASREKIYCITRGSGSLTTHMSIAAYDIRVDEHIKTYRFIIDHYGKRMCRKLNVTGAARLYDVIEHRYGIKKFIEVMSKFQKNKIPIFSVETFKPKHLCHVLKARLSDKKYYVYGTKNNK